MRRGRKICQLGEIFDIPTETISQDGGERVKQTVRYLARSEHGHYRVAYIDTIDFEGKLMPIQGSGFANALNLEISEDEISKAPLCDKADFVCVALKATEEASLQLRRTIQSDVAHTLNCRAEALSFLWAQAIPGAETLDCEIPDFREACLNPHILALAAE